MADLLAQFDIVERAEQARDGRGGAGSLGGGGDRARAPINPFDDIQELRPVAAMQVIHIRTYSVIDSRLLVLQSHTKSKWLQISLLPPPVLRIGCTQSQQRSILYSAGASSTSRLGPASPTSPSPKALPAWSL